MQAGRTHGYRCAASVLHRALELVARKVAVLVAVNLLEALGQHREVVGFLPAEPAIAVAVSAAKSRVQRRAAGALRVCLCGARRRRRGFELSWRRSPRRRCLRQRDAAYGTGQPPCEQRSGPA